MHPYAPSGCIRMHQYASVCVCMHPYASVCIRMHSYASGCNHMHPYASVCMHMQPYASFLMPVVITTGFGYGYTKKYQINVATQYYGYLIKHSHPQIYQNIVKINTNKDNNTHRGGQRPCGARPKAAPVVLFVWIDFHNVLLCCWVDMFKKVPIY